ncbi:MAG: hypothetical protein JWP00_4233 [Chloroflexi bacterium]|nr:hypothetical protein [Chloroflexota bacterium]
MRKDTKKASSYRRSSGALGLILMLSLLLVACGDAAPTTAPSATVAPAATTAAAASATTAAAASATTAAAASATTAAAAAASATTAAAGSGATFNPFSGVKVASNIKGGAWIDTNTKVIKVGQMAPLTGSNAPTGTKTALGVEVFFKWLNDNGGIGGYKVEVQTADSQYSPQVAVQQYNKISANVALFAEILGTPIVNAIKDQINTDKIFTLAATGASTFPKEKYMIITPTPYPVGVLNSFDYVVNQTGKKAPKTAIFYQDDTLGQEFLKGYEASVKAYGLQDVGKIPFKIADKDFTAQATALKNSGAEYVLLGGIPQPCGQLVSTASSIGYNPKYMLTATSWDKILLESQAKDSLTGGIVIYDVIPWAETDKPGMAQLVNAIKKYAPNQAEDNFVTNGWIDGVVAAHILKNALESGDMTRDGILAAAESVKDADMGQLLPPLTLGSTPDRHIISRESRIALIDPTKPSGVTLVTNFFSGEPAKNFSFK